MYVLCLLLCSDILTSTVARISHKRLSQLQRAIIVSYYHNCTKIFKLTTC
jgi:hypothetical protein